MVTARSVRLVAGTAGLAAAGAVAAHLGPSVVSLGPWTRARVSPGGWCRWRGPDVPAVALTFDDGPDPSITPLVLDRLDALGLRATFFCLGEHADAHPGLVTEIARRGHGLGCHGYRHDHHLARSPRWIDTDLAAGIAALGRAAGGPATAGTARRTGRAAEPRSPRPSTTAWSWCCGPRGAASGRRRGPSRSSSASGRGWSVAPSCCCTTATPPHRPAPPRLALEALGPIAEVLHRRGLAATTLDALVSGDAAG